MSQSRIPNSIILFLNCHGSESGNLVDQTTFTAAGFYKDKNHCLNDLQENVKITLSSAASVSSYETQVSNPVGIQKTFAEYAQDIPLDHISLFRLMKTLNVQTNHDFYKDVYNKTIGENEVFLFCFRLKLSGFTTFNDIFRFVKHINFSNEQETKHKISQLSLGKTVTDDDIQNYYNFFLFFRRCMNATIIYNPELDKYNGAELMAINEAIQFYCIDNANHKITDAMYYHCRLLIKNIFEKSIQKEYNESYLKKTTSERLIIWADKNNEKIIDVKIDEHSMNRRVGFKDQTLGPYIIKAYHDGNTFCAGVNEFTTEQYIEAGEDYENPEDNSQHLLSSKNPFIQNILTKLPAYTLKYVNYLFSLLDIDKSCSYDQIIFLCKRLGFEKIYITDTSCRPNYDTDSLNIAMRPSDANLTQTNEFFIEPDDPMVGDMVNFALPGQFNRSGKEKWSQQPGKIVSITYPRFSIFNFINEDNKDNKEYTINTSTNYSGVKVIKRLAEDDLYQFIIPETETWSSRPGRIIREYENSTGTSYDIEVPGETFENVLKVEDFIKMRSWVGGKNKTRKQRSNKKKHKKKTKHIIR